MKTHALVAATVLTVTATMDSTMGMRQFLQELPNGSLFQQALGHPGDDSSQETDFAQAFDNAGQSWTKSLCEAKFSWPSMTSGQALETLVARGRRVENRTLPSRHSQRRQARLPRVRRAVFLVQLLMHRRVLLVEPQMLRKGWAPIPASDATKGNTGGSIHLLRHAVGAFPGYPKLTLVTSQVASHHQNQHRQNQRKTAKMKTQVVIATAALTIAATMDSAYGLAKYLNELPNGSSFEQALGHPGGDSSKTTDFAKAFAAADHTWSSSLCEAKFPGSSMTNGAAFGDPCCTWKKGGKPDFTVTAFTTTPGKATTCASKGGASELPRLLGGTSDTTESSDTGASDATKGGTSDTTESSDTGASDATRAAPPTLRELEHRSQRCYQGQHLRHYESSDTGASDATTDSSTSGAGAATKGSPWGSSSTPTSGGGQNMGNVCCGGGNSEVLARQELLKEGNDFKKKSAFLGVLSRTENVYLQLNPAATR
ncbi:hypothetical protein GQ600_5002 [Phytophthora cactorum]|nr:hypothetical protein GQ600_5002 [Phytophthora cactorum]